MGHSVIFSYMSKLRSYKRRLNTRRITTALMIKRLVTEAGSMKALRADLPGVFEKVYGGKQQREVEVFAPAGTASEASGGAV